MAYIDTAHELARFRVIGEEHGTPVPESQLRIGAKTVLKEAMHHDSYNTLGALMTNDQYAATSRSARYPERKTISFGSQNGEKKMGLAEPRMRYSVWRTLDLEGVTPDDIANFAIEDLMAAKNLHYGLVGISRPINQTDVDFEEIVQASQLLLAYADDPRKNSRNLLMAQTGVSVAKQYRRESRSLTPEIDLLVGSAHVVGVSQAFELSEADRIQQILQDPQVRLDYDLSTIHERLLVQMHRGRLEFIPFRDQEMQKAVQRLPRNLRS